MKKVMILGASRYYIRSILAAKNMGCWVLAVDRDSAAEGRKYADVFEATDITDSDRCVEIARKYRVDAVLPLNDFGVPTAAAVAQSLNLIGLPINVAEKATNKAKMRHAFDQYGIPSVRFRVVQNLAEAYQAIGQLGSWPLILKPTDSRGGGSRGVTRIDSLSELPGAMEFAQSFYPDKSVVIEEFVEGIEHSVETVTYGGNTHILAISDKVKTLPPYRVDKSVVYPTISSEAELMAINETSRAAVRAIGIDVGAAHVELCTTKDGPKLFEVGARCGGGGTPDPIVPFVTGIEMTKEAIRVALGEEPKNLKPLYNRGCVYRFLTPRPGRIKAVVGLDEIRSWKGILDSDVLVKDGDWIRPVRTGGDRAGFIIAGGETREEAITLADKAEQAIQFEYEKD